MLTLSQQPGSLRFLSQTSAGSHLPNPACDPLLCLQIRKENPSQNKVQSSMPFRGLAEHYF